MNRGLRMRKAHTQAPNSVPGGRRNRMDLRYVLQETPNSVPGGKMERIGLRYVLR